MRIAVLDSRDSKKSRLVLLEVFVDWVGIVTVHFDFGQYWKGDAEIQLTELLDLFVRSRFLAS